jgi:CBS domain-containing protein
MKVANILKSKGSFVYSVTANASVYDALKMMAEKNIGALMVIEQEKLIGIFSERDYARKIVLQGKASHDTPVSEIMTEKVLTVLSEDSLEHCMSLMSKNKVRHLPVVDNEKVNGIISISDVVTAIIENQQETIKHLQEYISQ